MIAGIAHKWSLGWFITNIGNKVLTILSWIHAVTVTTSFVTFAVLVVATYIPFPTGFVVPAKSAFIPPLIWGFNTSGSFNFF
jgi:hypothetical protein